MLDLRDVVNDLELEVSKQPIYLVFCAISIVFMCVNVQIRLLLLGGEGMHGSQTKGGKCFYQSSFENPNYSYRLCIFCSLYNSTL